MSGFEPRAVIVFFAPTRTLTVHTERTKQQSYIRTYVQANYRASALVSQRGGKMFLLLTGRPRRPPLESPRLQP